MPQGSVLGPLFFLIFIGDISEGVSAVVLIYVDDSKVHNNVKNDEDVQSLQHDLDKIYQWEKNNNMKWQILGGEVWKKCNTKGKYIVFHL